MMERFDTVVVGGGIIGLASARRAQQRGLNVCVLERGLPGRGATHAAAGVLAPDPVTKGFTALARRSAELWPAFADELGDVGYTRCGSLVLAFDGEQPADAGEWIDGAACRALEPGIAPSAPAASCFATTRRSIHAVWSRRSSRRSAVRYASMPTSSK
jgi:glycine oxidase